MNKPVLPVSSLSLKLPNADRSVETYRLAASRTFPSKLEGTLNRVAFSATHVVADPLADLDPWLTSAVDWDRTIAFREHVWDLGLGVDQAMDVAVGVINANASKVDGVKVSLLDKQREIDMRRRLDGNVKMYTGDDFNYAELIAGDDKGFSHALLGIFDAIAPAASYALSRLAAGDEVGFHDVLGPTVPLSRHIFKAPTRFYKTGIVFMAYLNGHQDHFTMVGGQ